MNKAINFQRGERQGISSLNERLLVYQEELCSKEFVITLVNRKILPPVWDTAVGIANGYGLDGRGDGVQVPVGARFLSSYRPDRIRGPPNLLSNVYTGLFPRR
jgi:hypothetical protein